MIRTHNWISASALILLAASAALAQMNVSPGRILGGVQQGEKDHAKELDEAMNGQKPEVQLPADFVQNGWTTRKGADGKDVRLYVQHPAIDPTNMKANMPALIVVQEWWGVNDDIERRTQELAAKGYFAVAVDLYDGKVTKDPAEAGTLRKALTDDAAVKKLKVGTDFLADLGSKGIVDPARIGVIGWCMGGQEGLLLAVNDDRIKATVVFYGPLVTDERLKNLKGPVLGIFGNDDKGPSPADVDAFEKELKAAGIVNEIHRYDGAGHAFASVSARGLGLYRETQAKDAWEKTYAWLSKTLKPGT